MARPSSSHLHVLVLGLALAVSVSCRERDKTAASEPKPAPAETSGTAAGPTAAATATTSAQATTAKPTDKTAPAEVVDSTVKAVIDTAQKGPSGEAALLGKPAPAAKGLVIPAGATAECHDSTYSMSQQESITCKGHGGVRRWLKP
jgi:hypothetical protein